MHDDVLWFKKFDENLIQNMFPLYFFETKVAAVHHSEAYRIGILRNAKINSSM